MAAPVENGPPCSALAVSKNGEPRIPLGFARFTLLKTLRTETPKGKAVTPVRTGRHSPLAPPPNSGPRGPPRLRPRPPPPPGPSGPPARAAVATLCLWAKSESFGQAQVQREMGGARTVVDGKNSFRSCGQIGPGVEGSERCAVDVWVSRTDRRSGAQVAVETNPGRSLKTESPFRSFGEVMLKGEPELATMNGLRRKAYGKAIVPPKKRRWRVSNEARP